MAYEDYEQSIDGGKPVLLFEFARAGKTSIRYTSATTSQTLLGQTYTPAPIRISGIRTTKEVQAGEVTITVPRNMDFPIDISGPYAQTPLSVIIRRKHRGDGDSFSPLWRGRVVATNHKDAETSIVCENLRNVLRRLGNFSKYQRLCRHGLYSFMCGVSYTAKRVAGEVTAVDDAFTVRVDSASLQSDGYYKGGVLEFDGLFGFIISHVGNVIRVIQPIEGLIVGSPVHIAPGCDLRIQTCRTKFDNKARHGGFALTPVSSPFGGTNIFSTGG